MATLTVQSAVFTGLNYTLGAASAADVAANDGKMFLLFQNTNASARTLTLDAVPTTVDKQGFGTITITDTTVTLPGSGTNSGFAIVGPFPPDRFNNSSGQISYTLDVATGMNVAAIKLTPYA